MIFRNSLILISAITAALAAPLAFAQSGHASATTGGPVTTQATSPAMPATPAVPATPPTDDAAGASSASGDATATGTTPATPASPATPATPAPSAMSAKAVNWSQLDSNNDGKLSKTEAAPVKGLSKVFDQADADKDGALTADEYKAYLAARGQGSKGHSG